MHRRSMRLGLLTVLGLARRGFFIPYRYAHTLPFPGRNPPYSPLEAIMAGAEPKFAALLAEIDGLEADLAALGHEPPPSPRWTQDWFPTLDAAAAYAIVRGRKPKRIVEVGSGHSTRFMKRAADDGGHPVPDKSSPHIHLEASVPGKDTVVSRYGSSLWPAGAAELWKIQGGGHVPSLTSQFPTKVIKWLYRHPKPGVTATRYCSPAVANSSGQSGWLDASGSDAVQHNNFFLTASNLPTNQFGYFLCSLRADFVSNPGGSAGNLCLGGTILRLTSLFGNTGTSGTLAGKLKLNSLPGQPPNAVVTGDTWYFPTWFRDQATSNITYAPSLLLR